MERDPESESEPGSGCLSLESGMVVEEENK